MGRIRYLGNVLYDASRIEGIAKLPDDELIEAQRSMILDPRDPKVIEAALAGGMHESVIESAQRSPIYKFVKEWKLALPPHLEWRTFPMLFYVPPMSPVMASKDGGVINHPSGNLFHDIDESRVPLAYLAKLLGCGQESKVRYALRKQKAVRWYRRAVTVGDVTMEVAQRMLAEADCSVEEAEAIYQLTALCTFDDRFVIPPMHREEAIEMMRDPLSHKASTGFGFVQSPQRGM